LLPSLAEAGLLLLSFIVPLAIVLIGMPPFLRYLTKSGRVVDDSHKQPPTKVPSPAGPVLFIGALAGEALAYIAFGSLVPVALAAAAAVAFAVGLADDLFVLGGKTKPLFLILAGVPLVAFTRLQPTIYFPDITFPILGDTNSHFFIYTVLVIAAFPIVANAFNMMDSFNGQISWFTLLSSLALLFGASLRFLYTSGYSLVRLVSVLPLVAVALGFLVFNRHPSRAFDGDSGALMFGAMFAGLAVTCGVEVAAMIAIVPAILNSFYTLSSVRGFVERRAMALRPTYVSADGLIHATVDPHAPTTLVRLILLAGPLTESELVKNILSLTAVSCVLSLITSLLTWVF
jgi:UDP-N-acetylmuramyl pentapeptide phosphotransferase/UDP-N-acetylglucosamine-1-phosphate transferase